MVAHHGGLLLQEHATLVDSGIVSALCYVDIVDTYDGVSTNCAAEVVTCCNVAGKFWGDMQNIIDIEPGPSIS